MSSPLTNDWRDPATARRRVEAGLRRRYRAERRFRLYGLLSVLAGLGFVVALFGSIIGNGYTAFRQTELKLSIDFAEYTLGVGTQADGEALGRADYAALVKGALHERFPEVKGRRDRRALNQMVSTGAPFLLRDMVLAEPSLIGTQRDVWLPVDDDIDMLMKGHIDRGTPESERRISDMEIGWIDALAADGHLRQSFNKIFFTAGDSREPELAGIRGAVVGSALMLIVTLLMSFPVGVATAVYLEEFAPRNRWTDLVEVNINNLAAVPSIVFGLLGLAVFINLFGMPRSAPLVGGLVLTLMTLPTVIIASRAALKAVPPSIRQAAFGLGASKMQCVTHHVLPLAMPGMLTGAIIGMAQALGETAPLLMIGMVAFIVDVPGGFTDPATALPVQIFLWAASPERAFMEKTSAAIMVLLLFLATMNALAVVLRGRFEKNW